MRPETVRIRALRRTAVPVAGFCLALALSACTSGQSSSREAATTSVASVSTGSSPAGSGGGAGASGQTAASPRSAAGGQCPAGTKEATIGANKSCLAAGQLCEKTERAAYPAYGLLCLPRDNQYVLVNK